MKQIEKSAPLIKILKKKKARAQTRQIAIMLSQIQPHFLYNSLVVIEKLCEIDPKMAAQTVVEFSEYLRANLDSLSFIEPISFERELHHVQNYLSIEKKKLEKNLNIIYDVRFTDFSLPALTLQPIVENAVRYGVALKAEGGSVMIRVEKSEDRAIISVTDDGPGFDPWQKKYDGRTHIGLENVKNRLVTMCGGTLEINNNPGAGTTAIITIPLVLSFAGAADNKRLRVQCFGNFEVFLDNRPLIFARNKTKELFAYLVYREGTLCNNNEIAAVLWEERIDSAAMQSHYRHLVADLTGTLNSAGLQDVLIKKRGYLAIVPDSFQCDYFDYHKGLNTAAYRGEFMTQYSWAEGLFEI